MEMKLNRTKNNNLTKWLSEHAEQWRRIARTLSQYIYLYELLDGYQYESKIKQC